MTTRTPKQPLPKILAPDQIIPTMEKIVNELRRVRDEVSRNIQPSEACFENAIKPLIDVENQTQGEVGVIAMLRYAAPEEEARAASEEACKLWSEGESAFKARADIYLVIEAVNNRSEPLPAEAAKYLHMLYLDFRRAGHGVLDADQIQEYAQRMLRIEDLKRQFNQNLRDEDEAVLFRREELQGVPQHTMERFPVSGDLLRVSFRQEDRQAVMKYAENAATRKALWVASERKVPQNVGIFKKAMILRDKNARLLGYESHAAFRVEKKVAKTPERVIALMDSLEDALMPRGKIEMDDLLTLRRKHLEGSDEPTDSMQPWDYSYYTRIAEENLGLDHTEISEYFPLEYTVGAMLDIFASFLQLRFERLASLSVEHRWHEDIMAWSVWDERHGADDAFVGYLYADLLSRPNKYQGNQNVNLQCGYTKDDGSRVYPATILMCSFTPPTSSGCALLKHHEVVTLFHELGHGIHDLVSKTAYTAFHGHRAPADFAEAPSIMLENWCWMKDELRRMSCHYSRLAPKYLEAWQTSNPGKPHPPEKCPDELLEGLIRSRNHNRAMWYLRQLAFARFDMEVHHVKSHEDCIALDETQLYNDITTRLFLVQDPGPENRGHGQSDFGHLMAGYDAGYYSYLSAHVFAADLFESTFADNPRDQDAWDRYRRGILQPGGSRDEMQMMEEFLGRPINPQALLRGFATGA
ncbi:peptidase family M3 [Pestalotiopsis sp. NC0098]|nr:peptidase family M3 [Pestalotiopsis sp. NC0098]